MKHVKFNGRLVMVGFGSIGQGVLPLILRHIDMPREKISIITAAEVGTLGRDEVLAFAEANDDDRADALLMPDTALHTAAWLDELEDALGKPVLTANQVSAWEALRLAGARQARDGMGELFRRGADGEHSGSPG